MIRYSVVCDQCGAVGRNALSDGALLRSEVEELRRSDGWLRVRRRHNEANRDHCPECAGELKARKATRNGTTRNGGLSNDHPA